MSYTEVEQINLQDYVFILQDGCIKVISYENFIKKISLGGDGLCEAVLKCWKSNPCFEGTVEPEDTPPTFINLSIQLDNRTQNRAFTTKEFLDNYYDVDGDAFKKIVVTGGDLAGFTYDGATLTVGQTILAGDLSKLKYNAKDVDEAYTQFVEIDVYDENNIKAI